MSKLCKCGCGKETTISWDKKKINDYINGHGPRGKKLSEEVIEKRQISRIYGELRKELNIPIDYDYPLCACGCNKKVKHRTDTYLSNHQPSSFGMKGKRFSKETKQKLSKLRLGIKFTEKRKENISKALSGDKNPMFGKKFSKDHIQKLKGRKAWNRGLCGVFKDTAETRFKKSISAIKYINSFLSDGKTVRPNLGRNETYIIDSIEKNIDVKGISNDKELFLKCGKWPDRYYKKYNLCLEILEPFHFKPNKELKENDKVRELIITSRLSCMIYYVSEQDFLKNPENEILKFRNFVEMLEQGKN